MQAHQINVSIWQQALIPLPLFKYFCKLFKNVVGIIHHLFYVFSIQAPPMVRTELDSNFFQYPEYFCFNTLFSSHLWLPHFLQFGLLVSQCTACFLELVDKAILNLLKVVELKHVGMVGAIVIVLFGSNNQPSALVVGSNCMLQCHPGVPVGQMIPLVTLFCCAGNDPFEGRNQ